MAKTFTATENGIVTLFSVDEQGENVVQIALPVNDIPSRADFGEWDDDPVTALQLLAEWMQSQTELDNLLVFRWLVANRWISDQTEQNGQPFFDAEDLPLRFPLFAETTRRALMNNIERIFIVDYGHTRGQQMAVEFYQRMLDADHGALELSDTGRDVMTELHRELTRRILREREGGGDIQEVRH
ncbi:hypothetical protein [Sodalis praecaptivus]|uniref:hypothetical protein n=1 Tax=Sodalis praecaptivus TaxID=1239307 RepID=UPI0027FDFB62|nr:hypothetical protein [Sodalis praecaptivus]CAJ0995608.1 hypothetical protein NVIRENTERO_01989 [Sodalis praecaptivus]